MLCFLRCSAFDPSGYFDWLDVLCLLLLFAIVAWMAVRDANRLRKPPRRQAKDVLADEEPQQHPSAPPNNSPKAAFTPVSCPGSRKEIL